MFHVLQVCECLGLSFWIEEVVLASDGTSDQWPCGGWLREFASESLLMGWMADASINCFCMLTWKCLWGVKTHNTVGPLCAGSGQGHHQQILHLRHFILLSFSSMHILITYSHIITKKNSTLLFKWHPGVLGAWIFNSHHWCHFYVGNFTGTVYVKRETRHR